MAACLLAFPGCGEGGSPGNTRGQAEEHAGHVIPVHKPKNFPEGVRRLRELNDQFNRDVVEGRRDKKALHVALDVATWLPEIAADSDMPEAKWNEVNLRSSSLVEDYQERLSDASANARGLVEAANVEIGHLGQLLLACDSKWFGGTDRRATAP